MSELAKAGGTLYVNKMNYKEDDWNQQSSVWSLTRWPLCKAASFTA
jgi:hypothetical protein